MFGMIGASIATLISSIVMVLVSYNLNKRYYEINYEFLRIFHLSIVFIIIIVIDRFIPYDNLSLLFISRNYIYDNIIIMCLIKWLLLFVYPVYLIVSGFLKIDESREMQIFIEKTPFIGKILLNFIGSLQRYGDLFRKKS